MSKEGGSAEQSSGFVLGGYSKKGGTMKESGTLYFFNPPSVSCLTDASGNPCLMSTNCESR